MTHPTMHIATRTPKRGRLHHLVAGVALLGALTLALPSLRAGDAPSPADLVRENALLKAENLRLKQELATLKGKDPAAATVTEIKPVAGSATDPDTVNAPLSAVLGLLNDKLEEAASRDTSAQRSSGRADVYTFAKGELAKIDRILLVGTLKDVVRATPNGSYSVQCSAITSIGYKTKVKRILVVRVPSEFTLPMDEKQAIVFKPGDPVIVALKITYINEHASSGPGIFIKVSESTYTPAWTIGSTDYRIKVGDTLFKSQ